MTSTPLRHDTAPDPGHCPLCGLPNQCAMQAARASGSPPGLCWCTTVTFEAALLARVPPQAQRKACICQTCATRDSSSR